MNMVVPKFPSTFSSPEYPANGYKASAGTFLNYFQLERRLLFCLLFPCAHHEVLSSRLGSGNCRLCKPYGYRCSRS